MVNLEELAAIVAVTLIIVWGGNKLIAALMGSNKRSMDLWVEILRNNTEALRDLKTTLERQQSNDERAIAEMRRSSRQNLIIFLSRFDGLEEILELLLSEEDHTIWQERRKARSKELEKVLQENGEC